MTLASEWTNELAVVPPDQRRDVEDLRGRLTVLVDDAARLR